MNCYGEWLRGSGYFDPEMDSVETIKPRVDPQLGADAYVKKRRTGIKEEASFRSSKGVEEESKMDDGAVKLNSELLTLGSSAPESSASQSGGASDGEVVSESEEQGSMSTCVPHGSMSVIGRRRAMEDALTVAPGEFASYDFYAVYDGHGGAKVAYACRDRLHRLLAKEIEDAINGEGRIDWENVMVASFSKMDEEINGEANQVEDRSTSSLLRSMGSTAVVVVVGPEKLVVANCGDSRAVLCRRGVAVPLSRDHKVTCLSFTPSSLVLDGAHRKLHDPNKVYVPKKPNIFIFPSNFLHNQTHLTSASRIVETHQCINYVHALHKVSAHI